MKKVLKRKVLVMSILVVAILSIAIFIVKQPNEKKEESNKKELLPKIKSEIEHLFLEPEAINKIGTTRWSVDEAEKRINIFVWELTPENEKFNGMKIDGWTINIIEDLELKKEVDEINTEFEKLKEKPEMQIGTWDITIDPKTGSKIINVWVHDLTPENQKLHNTTINGWIVYVYKSLIPPKEVALNDPRIKEKIGSKKYEVTEVTKQSEGKLLVDVYIYI